MDSIKLLSAGLVGLGDLLKDSSLPTVATGSAGIAAIPGIDAETLETILGSIADSVRVGSSGAGGNTYQIDLRGAVVRDEGMVDEIIEAFEARMRSLEKG